MPNNNDDESSHSYYTRSTLNKLKPDEIIDIALKLQEEVKVSLTSVTEEIKKLNDTFTSKLDALTEKFDRKLAKLEADLSISKNTNNLLERKCHQLDQYSRRECLEIKGVPENVKHEDLRSILNPLFGKLGADTSSDDSIQACHRLSRRTSDIIVKFTQRDTRNKVLMNRKSLKTINMAELCNADEVPYDLSGIKIFINENLCPYYKRLFGMVNRLYKRNMVSSFWTINGCIRIVIDEGNPYESITHIQDLEKLFPEIDFDFKRFFEQD